MAELSQEDAVLFQLYKTASEAVRSSSYTVDCLKRQLEDAERNSMEAMRAMRSLIDYMHASNRKHLIHEIEEWEETTNE